MGSDGEAFDESLGMLEPFPKGWSGCAFCPAYREDPFVKRAIWRGILACMKLGKKQRRRFFWVLFGLPAIACGIVCEVIVQFNLARGRNMMRVLSILIVLMLIVIPCYLIVKRPGEYNVVSQVLFSVLLCGASAWFGISVNSERARKEATAKWVPAAETACKQLLTMSAGVERMKQTLEESCKRMEPVLPALDEKELSGLKCLVEMQCKETCEKLATLRDHVESAVSHWEVFIGANCEGAECERIEERIRKYREQLFRGIDGESCGS